MDAFPPRFCLIVEPGKEDVRCFMRNFDVCTEYFLMNNVSVLRYVLGGGWSCFIATQGKEKSKEGGGG